MMKYDFSRWENAQDVTQNNFAFTKVRKVLRVDVQAVKVMFFCSGFIALNSLLRVRTVKAKKM